jgi:nicotinamide-nucleotide amidase
MLWQHQALPDPMGVPKGKPVGTVWIALAKQNGVISQRFQFGDHRGRNIQRSSLAALNMLRMDILSKKPKA